MALFLSIFPIVLLIWLMVKNSMPSYVALPITAVLIYAIKLFYFGDAGMLLNATAASGTRQNAHADYRDFRRDYVQPYDGNHGLHRCHPQMAGDHQPEPRSATDDYRLGFCLYD